MKEFPANPYEYCKKPKKYVKKRKRGRPRKIKVKRKPGVRAKRHRFIDTSLGSLMYKESHLEYELILEITGRGIPDADLIEAISYSSINPLFRKAKFRRALIAYRKNSVYYCTSSEVSAKKEIEYIKNKRKVVKNL